LRRSRREFLRSASAGAALVAFAKHAAWAGTHGEPRGNVSVWATDATRRHAAADPVSWKPFQTQAADAIVLDPSTLKQEILGFGGAFTDATCYILGQMPTEQRAALLHDLFSPDELALNCCRTTIGSSDYSRNAYTYDESTTPDPTLSHFSIDHDREYILPILRAARAVNPEIFLFSSPWSPPGWMKSANTILGGAMREEYFLRFLADYNSAGVSIDAVTVQNEVDTNQDGRMPQCEWGQQYEIEFVRDHLGPTLRKAGMDTKIWILDHNFDLWGRALDELSDAAANHYIDGVAWHPYIGESASMSLVHRMFPDKHAYWTEGGPDLRSPAYKTEWARWGEVYNDALNNWVRSITAWNLALDENGNPNIGPFTCGGVVTVENGTHQVIRSGQYWAFTHFSKHVRRGARVIATSSLDPRPQVDGLIEASSSKSTALTHSGFRNPDGSTVLVLANRGEQRRVQIVLGTNALEMTLPASSLYTLEWS
jgi:glucosylceramidase